MKKATLFAILCLACVAALLVLFIFPNILDSGTVRSFQVAGINYNSHGIDHVPYRKIEDTDSSTYDSEQLEISMTMRPRSERKFGNAFQTAMANTGARLELSPPDTLALVVGSTDKPGYTTYVLTNAFSVNKWHTFHLKINRTNHMLVEVDGVPLMNGRNPSLSYSISNIAIGTGFNDSRPFDGEIRDASLAYGFYKENPGSSVGMLVAKAALFVLALAFLFLFIDQGRRKETGTTP